MARIAHHARSAPTPNADDLFRISLHVKPFRLIVNCKDKTRILIGPSNFMPACFMPLIKPNTYSNRVILWEYTRGISYLCRVLGYDPKTIGRGLAELDGLEEARPGDRIRKVSAGRKRGLETIEGIDEILLMVLENYTAGDSMQEQVRWTNLTYQEIIDHMSAEGIVIRMMVFCDHREYRLFNLQFF